VNFAGRRLRLVYDSGIEIEGHYVSDSELIWKAIAGPPAGQSGTEQIQAAEVAPDVFFISWVEEGGLTLSQVLNLKDMKVISFVTMDMGGRRSGMLQSGTVTEV
jgi:phenolic acid decarboxylase